MRRGFSPFRPKFTPLDDRFRLLRAQLRLNSMSLRTEQPVVDLDQIRADYECTFHEWAFQVELLKTMSEGGADAASIESQHAQVVAAKEAYRRQRDVLARHLMLASTAAGAGR